MRARKPPSIISKRTGAEFFTSAIFTTMKLQMKTVARVLGVMSAAAFIQTAAIAEDQLAPSQAAASASAATDTRHGVFDGLDHRSSYGQGFFPERCWWMNRTWTMKSAGLVAHGGQCPAE